MCFYMKQRIITSQIKEKKSSKLGRIIVLTGARQTGKTTLAGQCFPDYTYLSIEDPIQRIAYSKLTAKQWKILYPQAVLDEVQKEPLLIQSIKSVYDQFPEPRYVLLGSSQFLLMEKVRESLAGRCSIFEIYPLTLTEICTSDTNSTITPSFFVKYVLNEEEIGNIYPIFTLNPSFTSKKQAFDLYLLYGGYPVMTHETLSEKEKWEWLLQYVKTFLERDVRDLTSLRDLEPFLRLQNYLAYSTGNIVNYSSMAKECTVTVPTVQRYMRYIEMSYQAIVIPAWFSSPLKRLIKAPKVHMMDPGIMRAILRKKGQLTGSEFESAIVAEIYKQIKSFQLPLNCYHLRTQEGKEVDLLLENSDSFIAIEIKQTEHINASDAKNLINLQNLLDKPLKHCFILSNDVETHHIGENITAMHAAAFLG